jgi:hypothetical protein
METNKKRENKTSPIAPPSSLAQPHRGPALCASRPGPAGRATLLSPAHSPTRGPASPSSSSVAHQRARAFPCSRSHAPSPAQQPREAHPACGHASRGARPRRSPSRSSQRLPQPLPLARLGSTRHAPTTFPSHPRRFLCPLAPLPPLLSRGHGKPHQHRRPAHPSEFDRPSRRASQARRHGTSRRAPSTELR